MGTIDSSFYDSTGTGSGTWTFNTAYSNPNPSSYIEFDFFQNDKPCIVFSLSSDSTLIVNGGLYYCDTVLTGIRSNDVSINLNTIYPNPVSGDFVHIRIPNAEVKNIIIYDLTGVVIKELPLSGLSTINLASAYFKNGIYFCSYFDGNGMKVYTERFVVGK